MGVNQNAVASQSLIQLVTSQYVNTVTQLQ